MELNVNDVLNKALTTRYKMYSQEEIDKKSAERRHPVVIVDSLAATKLVKPETLLPSNAMCISPNIATMMGVDALPFDAVIDILEIDLDELKEDLEKLKEANINLIVVGYGGYSINTLEFLYQFCARLGVTGLFPKIHIWEDDNLTFTNCLRIYQNLATPAEVENSVKKLKLFSANAEKYDNVLSSEIRLVHHRLDADAYKDYYLDKPCTLLGAPDFETRQLLEKARFIFGGHANDEVGLINNPVVNAQLTTESYGTINPTTLFLNLIKGAAMLPKALLNELPVGETIFEYNCKKEMDLEDIELDFMFDEAAVATTCESEHTSTEDQGE